MKNKSKLHLFIVTMLLITACTPVDVTGPPTTSKLVKFDMTAIDVGFNSPVTFVSYVETKQTFENQSSLLRQELLRYGLLYDKYNQHPDITNLKTINDTAGKGPLVVDAALFDLIAYSREWYELTQKTFDITLGAVLNVWHLYRTEGRELNASTPKQNGRVPSLEELERAHLCTGWDNLVLDESTKQIEVLNPCTQLDVGGIAKGFAVDQVLETLIQNGLEVAIINLGDSSIVTLGEKPDGSDWGIGISQPKRNALFSDNSVESLYFKGYMAISTSGDYQNYYLAEDGLYYAHLIDPSTLFPVRTSLRSVTVASDLSASASEALSKALFILDYEEALVYLDKIQALFPTNFIGAVWVYDRNEAPASAISVESEGFSVVHTENIKPFSRLYR
jgi:thiamine biosynthesis lipoprotein